MGTTDKQIIDIINQVSGMTDRQLDKLEAAVQVEIWDRIFRESPTMREVKFRFYNDRCAYPYKMQSTDLRQLAADREDCFMTDDSIVMQYTGLKDKNGKEIYEGDIIDCNNSPATYIIYHKYTAEFCSTRDLPFNPHSSTFWKIPRKSFNSVESTREVIGNIYENPELLGGNK